MKKKSANLKQKIFGTYSYYEKSIMGLFGQPGKSSHLSNNCGGWNKRVGVQEAKSTGLFLSIFELE